MQPRILRQINLTHSARAELGFDFIAAQASAGGKVWAHADDGAVAPEELLLRDSQKVIRDLLDEFILKQSEP